jgi:hypothetical protein
MSALRQLKQLGPLTWLALATAIAVSIFHAEGALQYLSTPIKYQKNGIDIQARTIIEMQSLFFSDGKSIVIAKIVTTSLAVVGIAAAWLGLKHNNWASGRIIPLSQCASAG